MAGTLLINGADSGGGAVTVGNSGALGGNGTISGSVTVNGSLAPATGLTQTANLTITNNLTFASGAALSYLFGAPGNNDMVTVSGAGHTLLLSTNTGGIKDVLNINALPSFATNGTYTLLQATGGAIFTDNAVFSINGSTAYNYALSFTNGANGSLVLTVSPGNPTLSWSGATNNSWDTTTVKLERWLWQVG